ncbi:Hint domain-containing protein [Phaeobacter porticola]|uniref:Hint domain protein n=1 Tax=Phaeobacter porticola TaxID=1844006 RepID=A0A1L3I9N7_9RHOB|nr:Hint domain-containing protein [Phaeobacter porticola]APG48899.1 Hint domain protein [Phaeobacter porticola]
MVAASELTYNINANATQMAETIFGDGVQVVNASYTGDTRASAVYSNGDTVAPGATPSDTGIILSTGQASAYTNSNGEANQSSNQTTANGGPNGDPAFNAAAGVQTFDASYLDVTFVPDGSVMTLQFVFASEEYPEFQNSVYQDFVGVWVNGEMVNLEIGNGDADPGNVNSGTNANIYLDNADSDYNTEMDGLTVTMTLTMQVDPGEENSIRIGIADVSDGSYDSNLLIAAGSVQTDVIAERDFALVDPNGTRTIDVLSNDTNGSASALTITHVNGVAVVAGDVITLGTGQQVQLNANGTLTLIGDGDVEDFAFTYTASNGTNSDVGYVEATSIPCFVESSRLLTAQGLVPVEELRPGDLVMTRDNGLQPVRWIGSKRVAATGSFAPIRIKANALGTHDELWISPQHRVLLRDGVAEMMFGTHEVLVAAKDLINDHSIRRQPGGMVTYVHVMFDDHQLVISEGLPTESFLPGPQTSRLFDAGVQDELRMLFPELDPMTGIGYGPAARLSLRSYEAQLLCSALGNR